MIGPAIGRAIAARSGQKLTAYSRYIRHAQGCMRCSKGTRCLLGHGMWAEYKRAR